MTNFQVGTILIYHTIYSQIHTIGKAIRPLFTDPVTYYEQYLNMLMELHICYGYKARFSITNLTVVEVLIFQMYFASTTSYSTHHSPMVANIINAQLHLSLLRSPKKPFQKLKWFYKKVCTYHFDGISQLLIVTNVTFNCGL